MNQTGTVFRKPNFFEQILNKSFGVLVGLGIGLRHNYLLQVPGRKTGRVYSTPIDLLEIEGRRFLVAGRGRTQWVRNAEAAGEIILKRGTKWQKYRIQVVPNEEKPEILKAYLDRFKSTVQRYFPIRAGSDPRAFAEIAERYPVFELSRADVQDRRIGWARQRWAPVFFFMMLLFLLLLLIGPYLILTLLDRWVTGFKVGPSTRARVGLSLFFIFTSIGHFIKAEEMSAMLPPFILYRIQIIYLTGVLEILGAIGVWIAPLMTLTRFCLILMLICFLPANIYSAMNHVDFGGHGEGPGYLLFRVPFQFFVVWWTYYATKQNSSVR